MNLGQRAQTSSRTHDSRLTIHHLDLRKQLHKLLVQLDEPGWGEVANGYGVKSGDKTADLLCFFFLGFARSDLQYLQKQHDIFATVFSKQADLSLDAVGKLIEQFIIL